MCVLNEIDRFHLVMDVVNRVSLPEADTARIRQSMRKKLAAHKEYIARVGDDMPEVKDWKWEHK
jgi:xylulose-5-phosphate/fructose-6-phosphate phosphoketolase